MTDKEVFEEFAKRLAAKGFKIKIDRDAYSEDDEHTCYALKDSLDKVFLEVDFHPDGSFYRMAGYDYTGGWYDEVDGQKY